MDLSIIVPIYNVEDYLEKCIESLLNQDTQYKYEIILINDGSTDNCKKICEKYLYNEKIKYIKKKNGGLSDARNVGLSLAKGKYISFIDSDDYVSSNFVNTVLENGFQKNSDMVIFGFSRIGIKGNIIYNYIPKKISLEEILSSTYACNKIYKKELFNNINFPLDKHYEDIFTVPKLYLNAKEISLCNEILYFYVERVGAITTKKDNIKILNMIDAYLELKNNLEKNYLNNEKLWKDFIKCKKKMKNNFLLKTLSNYSILFFSENKTIIIKKFKELDEWEEIDYIKFYFSKYMPKNYIKKYFYNIFF